MIYEITRNSSKLTGAVLVSLAAFVWFRGSFALHETTLKPSPRAQSVANDQLQALVAQAAQLRRAGQSSQAVPLLNEALALAESSYGAESFTTATVLNQIGMLEQRAGAFKLCTLTTGWLYPNQKSMKA